MKKLLVASLLLLCLALVLSACGEGMPAETTAEVTTGGSGALSSSEATTALQTTTYRILVVPPPFAFYTLSDFCLYMEDNPADKSLYEVAPSFPNNQSLCSFPGKFILPEQILPSLSESEHYRFVEVQGLDHFGFVQYDWVPYYSYSYSHNDVSNGGYLSIHVRMRSRDPDRDNERYGKNATLEWSEELECLLVKNKETGMPEAIHFYSLEGYEVEIDLPSPLNGNFPDAQEKLLDSDITELKEIMENPTFSCERLRIISETLRAMND